MKPLNLINNQVNSAEIKSDNQEKVPLPSIELDE